PEMVPQGAAPLLNLLRGWDGYMHPNSQAATIAHALRVSEVTAFPAKNTSALLQTLRVLEKGNPLAADRFLLEHLFLQTPALLRRPWSAAGTVPLLNPLNSLGITWLDGAVLPGFGDNYTVHAQNTNFNQSFRAVWDVGNWDAGGIVIPAGESGEPGSLHYADLTPQYESSVLGALPYSAAAVARHTVTRQSLLPP
nr:penicillin acylase family protein [Candidatus Eremiobacteraeota bacterium]